MMTTYSNEAWITKRFLYFLLDFDTLLCSLLPVKTHGKMYMVPAIVNLESG